MSKLKWKIDLGDHVLDVGVHRFRIHQLSDLSALKLEKPLKSLQVYLDGIPMPFRGDLDALKKHCESKAQEVLDADKAERILSAQVAEERRRRETEAKNCEANEKAALIEKQREELEKLMSLDESVLSPEKLAHIERKTAAFRNQMLIYAYKAYLKEQK